MPYALVIWLDFSYLLHKFMPKCAVSEVNFVLALALFWQKFGTSTQNTFILVAMATAF